MYIDLIGFEITKEKQKDGVTHIIVQSYSKEERAERKAKDINSPILGHLKPLVENEVPINPEDMDDLPF